MSAVASPSRASWLTDRQTYIGGTDVAALVGKNKWRTPMDVYLEKTGQARAQKPTAKMRAGTALEQLVLEEYCEITGIEEVELVGTIRDAEFPFLACNPDGFVGENCIVEAKTYDFKTKDEWGAEGTDEVPMAYYVQTLWYLGLTSRDVAHIAAFDRGTCETTLYIIHSDPENYALLRKVAIDFWQRHIEPQVPPALTEGDASNIVRLFPEPTGEFLVAEPKDDALGDALLEAYATHKAAQSAYESLKAQMIVRIGEASGIDTAAGRFTLQRRAGRPSWQKIAAELGKATPEMIAKHTGEGYVQLQTPKEAQSK